MGAQSDKLQYLGVRLAVNQKQVGLEMAFTVISPFAAKSMIEDIVEAYLALRARPDELFVDTVKRLGVEPFRERVYATR